MENDTLEFVQVAVSGLGRERRPGARRFRRYLSEQATEPGANAETLRTALSFLSAVKLRAA